MILLIYVQVGARNAFTFVHAAALTVLVMFTGGFLPQYLYAPRIITQENAQKNAQKSTKGETRPLRGQNRGTEERWSNTQESSRRKSVFWLHVVSWVLFVQSYAPVFFITASSLGDAQGSDDNDAPVALIRAIVAVEFLFFASFGVVESVKAWVDRPLADRSHERLRAQLYFRTELAYVALSVTSKSILIFLTASSLSQMPEFAPATTCTDL